MTGTLVGLVLCLIAGPSFGHPDVPRVDFEQKLGASLALQASFADEEGHRTPLAGLFRGHPVVIVFGYLRCPNLCDTTLAAAAAALQATGLRPGDDFGALFVSVDPGDTPAVAAASRVERIPPGQRSAWHFLTGEQVSIEELTRAAGVHYTYDARRREYVHPAGLLVVTPAGILSRYFPGLSFQRDDLRAALVQAGRGNVGTLANRVLLLCRHLEPGGEHTALVLFVLRASVALFLAGAGVLLWRALHRDGGREEK